MDDRNLNVTKTIIEGGRSVNARDAYGRPLICFVTDHKIFDFLLSHPDFDRSVQCAGGAGLLHMAAMNLNLEAIEKLIGMGLDVNEVDARGNTPLYELNDFYFDPLVLFSYRFPEEKLANAKKIGDYVSATKLLISAGADLTKENNNHDKRLDRLQENLEAVKAVVPELLDNLEKD